MARIVLNSHDGHPTLSEVAVACAAGQPQSLLAGTTRQDVLAACIERGVPVVQGRIDAKRLADVYFALSYARGAPRPGEAMS